MKIISYTLRRFFPIFFGAMIFFVLVLCLTDLFMNIWNYISKSVSFRDVMLILFYYVPKTVWYSVPIAMLFGTAYMLSDFYARNELLAIFASGISLAQFSVPLLFVSIFMSAGLFFFEDKIVVPSYEKKVRLQDSVLYKEKSLNNEKIVVMSDGGNLIYKADFFENKSNRLFRVFVIFRNEDKSLDAIIFADRAEWNENSWKLQKETEWKNEDGELKKLSAVESRLKLKLTEEPSTFRNNTISVEQVNASQAKEYISHLEKAGLPCAEEKSVYYKKFSFPCIVFIVVFLAIGLSGKTRKNVLIVSLALSVIAVVLFYVLQMITMLMAKFQTIPPILGAWSPVVIFVAVSAVLLKFAKT